MAISYNKLWHILLDKKMTKTALREAAGMSTDTMARLSKDEPVMTSTLVRICDVLKCSINDILDDAPSVGGAIGERAGDAKGD